MVAKNEQLRINRYWDTLALENKLDLRYWKQTRKGLRPTSRAIELPMNKITRLIALLQREHALNSAEDAKTAARIEGKTD